MGLFAQELAADLVVTAGNQVRFDNTAGGVSWLARCDGGSNAFQFNYDQASTVVGNAPVISFRRSYGTMSARAACANNATLGGFNFRGHDGTALFDGGDIYMTSGALWTATEHTTRLVVRLTLTSGVKSEYYRFSPDGIRLGNGATQMNVNYITTGGLQWGTASTQKQAWWGAVPVVRDTGWGTPTGTLTKLTFDTATVTHIELAERVAALINTMKTLYGLLGA